MNDELNVTLKEVAELMRDRLRQERDMYELQNKVRVEREVRLANFSERVKEQKEDDTYSKALFEHRAAEREFHAKVVAELERHNDILERIARRLEASTQF